MAALHLSRATKELDTPSEFEKQIGIARRYVTGMYTGAHAQVQGAVSKWIGVERAIESASVWSST